MSVGNNSNLLEDFWGIVIQSNNDSFIEISFLSKGLMLKITHLQSWKTKKYAKDTWQSLAIV